MKKAAIIISRTIIVLSMLALAGCSGNTDRSEQREHLVSHQLTIGFSQVGSESDWRVANTKSMKDTFCAANGYTLIFDDAQQKQEKQITAIRNFIQQEVDYIILAPVTEGGWDTVLQEAKDAGIPVIIVDRMVDVSNDNLYTAWVGSDFRREGEKACKWLRSYTRAMGIKAKELHIVNIQGTIGATSQIGRTEALESAAKKYGWDLLASASGDYARTKSKEVMESMLKAHGNINVVYCENDNEAFGAIEALRQADKSVGLNIRAGETLVLSFDGTTAALEHLLKGEIGLVTECNPLQGPAVRKIIETLEKEGAVPKQTYINEKVFAHDDTVESVMVHDTQYDITVVSQKLIDKRKY